MMQPDNATDQTLTEGAIAPGQSEGKTQWTPCSGGTLGLTLLCPHAHRCMHNELIRQHAAVSKSLARITADITHTKWDGWEADLEYWTNRYIETNAKMCRSDIEHQQRLSQAERELLHATNKANAESKRGPHEFTLTYSPTKHGWNTDEGKAAMREAIERLTRYYREEIEEFHAVGELTQAGIPHVHAWYRLDGGRRITTKSFKRAYPIWNERNKLGAGHEGGHHAPVKRQSDFDGYIEKHLDTAWLDIHITNEPRTEEAAVQEASDDETPLPSEA